MTVTFVQRRPRADPDALASAKREPHLHEVAPPSPMLYEVTLRVDHPDIDPALISSRLGRKPQHSWRAGDPARTPAGTLLPDERTQSYWSFTKRRRSHRDFFDGVKELLTLLERHADFVQGLIAGGGGISITVQLSGRNNIGASIEAADMGRMAALGVSLGVEVFPDFTS